jgi:DNA-binding beta-propeller fold protein YncE
MIRHARWSFAALLSSVACAQMPRGGDYVAIDASATPRVLVVAPSGAVTTLHQGAPLAQPSGIAVTSTGAVLVADFSGTLYRIDAPGVVVPVASGLSGPIRVALDRNGDALVAELSAARVSRVTPQGVVTPVFSGAPLVRPFGLAVDPADGAILVADDRTRTLHRIDASGITPLFSGAPFRLPIGVALFANGDYAVADALVDGVFRVPRAGGSASLVQGTPVLGNPDGIVSNFDGSIAISESGAPNGNRIVVLRPDGSAAVIASGAAFSNLEALARVPHLQGAVRGTSGVTLPWTIEFPSLASSPFLHLVSASLHPGFALAIGETPMNPDPIFLSFVGVDTPLFQGFVGALDASGRASLALAVPNVPTPAGFALHVQTVVLDLGQPSFLGAIGNLHTVLF